MREKREKRAGRGPSSRAPRVSLAPKTAFPFPFIRLPRRLDQTVKKLIAFRSRKFIAFHSKSSVLNNAGVMWCAKKTRMRSSRKDYISFLPAFRSTKLCTMESRLSESLFSLVHRSK